MQKSFKFRNGDLRGITLILLSLLLFWGILFIKVPYALSYYLSTYYFISFLIVLLLYYLCYRLPDRYSVFAGLCLSMVLVAVPLSYKWSSGYSDNMITGGLLPYKDAKNYYYGANLIMNGLPLVNAGQSTERPLFPGFLSSLLLLTDQNLKTTLAIIVQLAGIGLYVSGRQIRAGLGSWAASFYITFAYFYIQPLIGYALSELLGFILGCFAFCLLWRASYNLKWGDLILGLSVLLMAVSARAGAFFIFPALIVWVGWIFRGEARFSTKLAACVFVLLAGEYFLFNRLYAQLLDIPPGSSFGNFSYAIYGQVRGGIGWHSAIEELGTRNPATVYRAALQFFLKHPMSLLIGFAKSYRDFFLPSGIFPFKLEGWQRWFDLGLWTGTILLLFLGLKRIIKSISTSNSALIVAGFIGMFLSIPFLPPIDGGSRFYASTVPFFFVLPAAGIAWLSKEPGQNNILQNDMQKEMLALRLGSILLVILTLVVPVVVQAVRQKPLYTIPSCPSGQIPFAIETHPGSYVDLVEDGTARCGFIPNICLSDFVENNTEKVTDDYYHTLMAFAKSEDDNFRIIPAINFIEEKFHYFIQERLPAATVVNFMSGCAVEIKTKNQSIYWIKSVNPNQE